jgi:drug/metabolite transporter (DMT)-like permease
MSIRRFTHDGEEVRGMARGGSGFGGAGVLLSLLAASTFGTSGSFATSLTDAGWSPGAAVAARVCLAAVILTVPAMLQLRRRWPSLRAEGPAALRRSAGLVGLFGLVAVAGCQLCFFEAVARLSVGVALMLEYLAVVLVVLWVWLRHGQTPRPLTIAGSLGALVGLVFVLDIASGPRLDPIGVLWGLGAAVGLTVFYLLSARADEPLPPIAMAWSAMTVGAVALLAVGAVGVLPLHAVFGPVHFAGHTTSWLVPVLGLSLIAAVISYVAGIGAARRLGARLASFLGLTEVLFAVLFAWLLLGQLPAPTQLLGGALIVAGVALVRIDELRAPATVEPKTRCTTPRVMRGAGSCSRLT